MSLCGLRGRPRTQRPIKDPDKRLSPRRKEDKTTSISVIKFGLLLEEIEKTTEKIVVFGKVYFLPPELLTYYLFFKQAGGLKITDDTVNDIYERVSQASILVKDSLSTLTISSIPSMHNALEDYSL